MQDEPHDAVAALGGLIDGYQVSQAIHVAATLGIADLLAGGPRSADELAGACGAHADALYRVLRALASVGVFEELDGRRFALSALAEPLRSDAPRPLAGWAAYIGRRAHWGAWGQLLHSVRTGETAFPAAHGMSVWEYRSRDREERAVFDQAMSTESRRANAALLDAYDFGRFGTVVDVGGGDGTFLAAMLERHPGMRGVLLDLPEVAATADLGERCRVVAGSFFDAVPGGGDAYVLKAILHNWDDEPATRILRACRHAVPEGGAVLIVERELGAPNAAPAAKLSDLNMLVGHGGRERTREEYADLLATSGFRLAGVTPTATGASVIEAR